LRVLADQYEIAERYAGTLFACALVAGPASYWRGDDAERDERRYWRGNIYARIGRPHVFARPLPQESFRASVTIRPGGATTAVHGPTFEVLKALLAERNRLPAYLADARPGGVGFRDVDATNWIGVACSPRARFIDESQLRDYLLTHLL
jgi:hypothetical protein